MVLDASAYVLEYDFDAPRMSPDPRRRPSRPGVRRSSSGRAVPLIGVRPPARRATPVRLLRRDEIRRSARWGFRSGHGRTGGTTWRRQRRRRGETGLGRRLAGYAWRYRRNVLLALGSSLAGMAVMALVPLVTKVIIDDVIVDTTRLPRASGPAC